MPENSFVRDDKSGALIKVHLTPKASRERIGEQFGGAVKVWVSAPPVDGKANTALLKLLAKRLKIPKTRLKIISGETSRNKVLQASGLTAKEAANRITEI